MNPNIKQLIDEFKIHTIDDGINYWFLRTEGGDRFSDFYFEHYIAIGWDDFTDLDYIREVKDEDLKLEVAEKYCKDNDKKPGSIVANIKKFICEFKIGDFVFIPSQNSERMAFGVITSDVYVFEPTDDDYFNLFLDGDDEQEYQFDYLKRRTVKWLKVLDRPQIDPFVLNIIHSHNTIVNANPYRNFINRSLFDLYFDCKTEKLHAVFNVTKKTDIQAYDWYKFIGNFFETIDLINNLFEDLTDAEKEIMNIKKIEYQDLYIKSTVNSPGPIEIIGATVGAGFLISYISLLLHGGDGKFVVKYKDFELSNELKTPGFFENIRILKETNHKIESEKIEQNFRHSKEALQLKSKEEILGLEDIND